MRSLRWPRSGGQRVTGLGVAEVTRFCRLCRFLRLGFNPYPRPHPLRFARNLLRPDSRNRRRARRTLAVVSNVHLLDEISITFYQQLAARRAVSVLPAADLAGKIPRVDKTQACLTPDLARANPLPA